MPKKCIECGKEASLKIKDSSEYYCKECAEEDFGDIALLVSLEQDAQKIKKLVSKLSPQEEEENAQDN